MGKKQLTIDLDEYTKLLEIIKDQKSIIERKENVILIEQYTSYTPHFNLHAPHIVGDKAKEYLQDKFNSLHAEIVNINNYLARNREAIRRYETTDSVMFVPAKPEAPPVRVFSEGGEYPRTCIGEFFRYMFKFKCKK